MKHVVLVFVSLLAACAGTREVEPVSVPEPVRVELRLGEPGAAGSAEAQQELERVLSVFGTEKMLGAPQTLEGLLRRYRSRDGRFERSVLATLALVQLELDDRAAFHGTVTRLRGYLPAGEPVEREIHYLLALDAELRGVTEEAPADIRVDPRLRRAIRDLLSSGTKR